MFQRTKTKANVRPRVKAAIPGEPATPATGQEAIIGAFGLPPGKRYISIKGDPTLRETVPLRPRQASRMDRSAKEVLEACEWLLRKSGCYAVYIGFNSNEIRTESVFNPFNYEIHDAEAILKEGYLERHFVRLPYRKKMHAIQKIRKVAHNGPLRDYLPEEWRREIDQKREAWKPVDKKLIPSIIQAFSRLREIDGFYLRYAALSLSQNIVRASFNCDGTYIVVPEYFPRFVDEIMP